ncbi:MAG TPA: VOC family protein [Bacteroidetes bacterium]|nr:VOC family protein [Bacteroidota bacterium]
MKRVTGIGGIFFKCKDPVEVKNWYQKHLGIESQDWGAMFEWRRKDEPEKIGTTAWNPFKQDTDYFAPSEKNYMFNYRVENLDELLLLLKAEGVEIIGKKDELEYGKFAWIMDPEGNKVELWEPVDQVLIDYEATEKAD